MKVSRENVKSRLESIVSRHPPFPGCYKSVLPLSPCKSIPTIVISIYKRKKFTRRRAHTRHQRKERGNEIITRKERENGNIGINDYSVSHGDKKKLLKVVGKKKKKTHKTPIFLSSMQKGNEVIK